MKYKKRIMFLSFLLLFSFVLIACDNVSNTPTKKVEEFLTKYQTYDSDVEEDLKNTIDNEDLTDEEKERYTKLISDQYKSLTYEIKNETIDGDNATVEVEIEVKDFASAIGNAEDYLSEHEDEFLNENDEYDNTAYTKYKLDEMEKVTDKVKYTLQLTLTKVDDEWKMDDLTETEKQKIHGIYDY